jgi:ORF6N domain
MSKEIIPVERIAKTIFMLRGERVMLGQDLAALYGVTVSALTHVKRNQNRFPKDFAFQLASEEFTNLKSQFVISSWGGLRRARPYAFTEQGVAMLSSILNSELAVNVNIAIMRAFVKLRQALETNRELARKFAKLERHLGKHDEEIAEILEAIRRLMTPPKKPGREIGFHVRERAARYRTRRTR